MIFCKTEGTRRIKKRGGEVGRRVQKVKMIAGKEKRGEDIGQRGGEVGKPYKKRRVLGEQSCGAS